MGLASPHESGVNTSDECSLLGSTGSSSKKPSLKTVNRDIWADSWLWEILGLAVSISCLVALIVVLRVYDQKAVPQLWYNITLNTIVSTLVTLSKTSLLVAVASGISQLKWHWLQHPSAQGRNVMDTQLFDEASRGPWGSLILLTKRHTWSLVSLGAATMVFSLVIDPFAQQLISYPLRDVPASDVNAGVPTISRATTFGWDRGSSSSLRNTLNGALWAPSSEDLFSPTAFCPGTNCTWEYETLTFCSACEDATDNLLVDGCSVEFMYSDWDSAYARAAEIQGAFENVTVPPQMSKNCGLRFPTKNSPADGSSGDSDDGYEGFVVLTTRAFNRITYNLSSMEYPVDVIWSLDNGDSWSLANSESWETTNQEKAQGCLGGNTTNDVPFMRLGYAQLHHDSTKGVQTLFTRHATVCSLTPCVRQHRVSITNGIRNSTLLDPQYGRFFPNCSGSLGAFNGSWVLEGPDNATAASNSSMFYIHPDALEPMKEQIRQFLGGSRNISIYQPQGPKLNNVSLPSDTTRPLPVTADFDWRQSPLVLDMPDDTEETYANTSTSDAFEYMLQQGGLSWVMPRVADSITSFIHNQSDVTQAGYSSVTETFVSVRWEWITLPVLAIFSGTLFLLLTIWTSAGPEQVLWKNSSLPFLYHGPERWDIVSDIRELGASAEKVSGMEKLSRAITLRLRRDELAHELRMERVS